MKTDWFEMRDARLHLAPYTDPHFKIAVASTQTPAAMIAAGKYGTAVLSLGAGIPGGPEALSPAVEDRRGRGGQARPQDGPQAMEPRRQHALRRGRRGGAGAGAEGRARRRPSPISRRHSAARRVAPTIRCARASRWARRWSARPRPSSGACKHLIELSRGGCRRLHVPRARMGEPAGHPQQLRAVRALGDAAVPGLDRPGVRLPRLGQGEPQGHLRALDRCREESLRPMPAARRRRTTRHACSARWTRTRARAKARRDRPVPHVGDQ